MWRTALTRETFDKSASSDAEQQFKTAKYPDELWCTANSIPRQEAHAALPILGGLRHQYVGICFRKRSSICQSHGAYLQAQRPRTGKRPQWWPFSLRPLRPLVARPPIALFVIASTSAWTELS
jgi:hypothetical protein